MLNLTKLSRHVTEVNDRKIVLDFFQIVHYLMTNMNVINNTTLSTGKYCVPFYIFMFDPA